MNDSNLPYRPGVGIMLINNEGRVFVARRIDMVSEAWQMPQGGIDQGETPEQALWRELGEEIGTNKADILGQSKTWLTYDLPNDLIPKLWGGKFRGQKQLWFALRFTGSDSDINIHTHEPEFSAWKWVAPDDVPKFIVPFKQTLYRQLVEEFKPFLIK